MDARLKIFLLFSCGTVFLLMPGNMAASHYPEAEEHQEKIVSTDAVTDYDVKLLKSDIQGLILNIEDLQKEVSSLKATASSDSEEGRRVRRNVVEQQGIGTLAQSCMPQCGPLCGPAGPAGSPGLPGRDGRDGRDGVKGETGRCSCPEKGQRKETPPNDQSNSGSVYIRWGRYECPSTSDLVYSGTAAGAHYEHKGGGGNYLCLPTQPIYHDSVGGTQDYRALIYGAEYEITDFPPYAGYDDYNVPCVVCKSSGRSTLLMVPARNICPSSDWILEYSGFLMSERYLHNRANYVCMDRDAVVIPGTTHNANGALFYPVEGRCGSSGSGLPCGPYTDGYELTCAVCTI